MEVGDDKECQRPIGKRRTMSHSPGITEGEFVPLNQQEQDQALSEEQLETLKDIGKAINEVFNGLNVNSQEQAETARSPSQWINSVATSVKAGTVNRNMIYENTNDVKSEERDGTNHNYDIETNGISHICNGDSHT
jgi:hypothetical protein